MATATCCRNTGRLLFFGSGIVTLTYLLQVPQQRCHHSNDAIKALSQSQSGLTGHWQQEKPLPAAAWQAAVTNTPLPVSSFLELNRGPGTDSGSANASRLETDLLPQGEKLFTDHSHIYRDQGFFNHFPMLPGTGVPPCRALTTKAIY